MALAVGTRLAVFRVAKNRYVWGFPKFDTLFYRMSARNYSYTLRKTDTFLSQPQRNSSARISRSCSARKKKGSGYGKNAACPRRHEQWAGKGDALREEGEVFPKVPLRTPRLRRKRNRLPPKIRIKRPGRFPTPRSWARFCTPRRRGSSGWRTRSTRLTCTYGRPGFPGGHRRLRRGGWICWFAGRRCTRRWSSGSGRKRDAMTRSGGKTRRPLWCRKRTKRNSGQTRQCLFRCVASPPPPRVLGVSLWWLPGTSTLGPLRRLRATRKRRQHFWWSLRPPRRTRPRRRRFPTPVSTPHRATVRNGF